VNAKNPPQNSRSGGNQTRRKKKLVSCARAPVNKVHRGFVPKTTRPKPAKKPIRENATEAAKIDGAEIGEKERDRRSEIS